MEENEEMRLGDYRVGRVGTGEEDLRGARRDSSGKVSEGSPNTEKVI